MSYLIVGLGNIGDEYQHTRHNIGFDIISHFAEQNKTSFSTERYGDIAKLKIKGKSIILLKPSTYMNLSGNAVRYWMQKEKVKLEDLLILVDDLSLSFGTIRLKPSGSAGGHNGLKHIGETLGTTKYARIRFGLGDNYARGKQIDFVIGKWNKDELDLLSERKDYACEMIKSFCLQGIEPTMNSYNKKKL